MRRTNNTLRWIAPKTPRFFPLPLCLVADRQCQIYFGLRQQNPNTCLIGSLDPNSEAGITGARLWTVMRRFFLQAATVLE